MPKKKLTLSIDEEIIQKAKKSGVNISQTVENFLKFGDACRARDSDSNSGRGAVLFLKNNLLILLQGYYLYLFAFL
jgi:hypothetical protein